MDLGEFKKLARSYRAIPVSTELVADMVTPIGAFMRCVGDSPGFILESIEADGTWSRYSFVGLTGFGHISKGSSGVSYRGPLEFPELPKDSMVDALEFLCAKFNSPTDVAGGPFSAGIVGTLGFEVISEIETVPSLTSGGEGSSFGIISEMAVFDHWTQRVTLVAVALLDGDSSDSEVEQAYGDAVERLREFASKGAVPIEEPMLAPPVTQGAPEVHCSLSDEQYKAAVRKAKEYIAAGDIFQVVLSKRFSFNLQAEPIDVYRVLRQINPSPYMFLMRPDDGATLVGCSPEPLVKVKGSKVTSRPIAGTRPRGESADEDDKAAADLLADEKEVAEHVMLVDLARNDLGRVAEPSSLSVDQMMNVERYSHVMHLTSEVSATVADDMSLVDVLRATFPAGTLSGTPKIRAMDIIGELEPIARDFYGGCVGYLDFARNLDSAITIRTMVISEGNAWVAAGAGIVADSDPESENQECWNKALALLEAVKPAEDLRHALDGSSSD